MKVWLVKPVKHDLNSRSSVFTPVSPISKTEILSSKYPVKFCQILPDSGILPDTGTSLHKNRALNSNVFHDNRHTWDYRFYWWRENQQTTLFYIIKNNTYNYIYMYMYKKVAVLLIRDQSGNFVVSMDDLLCTLEKLCAQNTCMWRVCSTCKKHTCNVPNMLLARATPCVKHAYFRNKKFFRTCFTKFPVWIRDIQNFSLTKGMRGSL